MTGGVGPTAGLDGQVVLVTGGSAGIGRAAAVAFAGAGMHVVIGARRSEPAADTVEEIASRGGRATAIVCDVSDEDQVRSMIAQVMAAHGRIDCAFNNAGVSGDGRLVDLEAEQYDRTFAVNARGLWLCLREELRAMSALGRGSIVNNTSVHGLRTVFPGIGAYVASKHAAIALTKIAALEHAAEGIRVNALAPGPIETEMLAASEAAVGGATAWRRLIPAGRVGLPHEIADAAMWLFSSSSSFVNGQVLAIDGGFTAA